MSISEEKVRDIVRSEVDHYLTYKMPEALRKLNVSLNMPVSIKLVQLKRKKRENGEIPIYIRFTLDRKSRYKSTGINVTEEDWDDENERISKTHPRYHDLNSILISKKEDAKEAATRLYLNKEKPLTIKSIKEMLCS